MLLLICSFNTFTNIKHRFILEAIIDFIGGPLLLILGIIIYKILKSREIPAEVPESKVDRNMGEASTIIIVIILVGVIALILLLFMSFFK